MTNEQMQFRMKEIQEALTLTSMQREGTLKFFYAACYSGNGIEAARLREQLHSLMDVELDSIASMMHLSKQGAS